MRPLIDILEAERTVVQKLESVYRYLVRTDDIELLQMLNAKRTSLEQDLNSVRVELREYIGELFKQD